MEKMENQIVKGKCPSCGAIIDVNPIKDAAICPECGEPVSVNKAVKKYIAENGMDQVKNAKDAAVNNGRKAVSSVAGFVGGAIGQVKEEKTAREQRIKEEAERQAREEKLRLEQRRLEAKEKREKVVNWGMEHKPIVIAAVVLLVVLIIISSIVSSVKKKNDTRITVPAGVSTLKSLSYDKVESMFADAGFTNVVVQADYDIIAGIFSSAGDIEKIEVDGYTTFASDSKFDSDVLVVITYHDYVSNDPALESEKKESSAAEDKTKEHVVLTKDNSEELAAILNAEAVNIDNQAAFAKKYLGETIEFECIVYDISRYENYDTRFNYIVVPGTSIDSLGASLFLMENVGYYDFKLDKENRPESVDIGSHLLLRAEILGTEDDGFYISISPSYTKYLGGEIVSKQEASKPTTSESQKTKNDSLEAFLIANDRELKNAYGSPYKGYDYDKSGLLTIKFVYEGMSQAYTLGNATTANANDIRKMEESLNNLSGLVYEQVSAYGKINVGAFLLNDINTDKVLFTSYNGKTALSALK